MTLFNANLPGEPRQGGRAGSTCNKQSVGAEVGRPSASPGLSFSDYPDERTGIERLRAGIAPDGRRINDLEGPELYRLAMSIPGHIPSETSWLTQYQEQNRERAEAGNVPEHPVF